MKNYYYLIILFVTLFSSCSSKDDISQEDISPKISEITTSEITATSALLSWEASISNKTELNFDIFIEDKKIAENIKGNSFLINNLEEDTQYSGKVLVRSKAGITSEKSFSFVTTKHAIPSSIDISVTNITAKSAIISWTEANINDNSEVRYDIYLDDKLLAENSKTLSYELKDLTPYKEYAIKIIAKSTAGKTSTTEDKFKTLGTAPSSFPLKIEADDNDKFNGLAPNLVEITWTPPTVEDGSSYHYDIYLNDTFVDGYFSGKTDTWVLTDLEEGKTYTLKVIAVSNNETKTEESITFTTAIYSTPTDFEISLKDVTSNSAEIRWTSSTDPDGNNIVYLVYLNGEQINAPNTSVNTGYYIFDNLAPNTEYVAKVIAKNNRKMLEKEITFTTKYETHPNLKVKEATLYTKNSQYFGGQLNVIFSKSIEKMKITEFNAGDITIGNYNRYPSAISTGILSTNDYNKIKELKKGYVLIKDNGKVYKIEFEISEETN